MAIWKIDASHSDVEFKVKHLMISSVTGYFGKYEGTAESSSDDFTDAKITFEADVNSISTKNEQRDQHLQAEDFFHAAQYPKLSFVSTGVKKVDDENYKVTGDLTMRGVTKPVELAVEFSGIVKDPYGQTKAGFDIKGKINRKDFGVSFHAVTDNGGLVLGDEVKLQASVQLVKQA
ncbi:Polyisoprenoid-binding protein YceI [Chitinophaga sp. YR627]|uniref:YceI family protein n=1 Tax=Chitinophaga pinensis TaxID=79329 RepID=A0A5C6LX50_9BACT|nr:MULTISPECIES: YceI family protein [Chitinophaga]TWW01833.1 YceI family protein [Chitinophaga pinensis]SFO35680.1 Polyisoprenoid-binding protein YceI [Chitinophaga sp. YR627]